jgi:hypothetical protein
MTGAPIRLESADTISQNPWPCTSGSVDGETDNMGEVEAKWEATGVSGSKEAWCFYHQTGENWSILGQGDMWGITGALIGPKPANTTLKNPWPYASGGIGSKINDVDKVKAK